jgi:hypothetical protein
MGGRHASKSRQRNSECYLRAEECRRWAETASTPSIRDDYLAMERRWLSLAGSYEFAEQLDDFTAPFNYRSIGTKKRRE